MKLLSKHGTTNSNEITDFSERIERTLNNIEKAVTLEVKPGDIIVVECGVCLRPEDREKISNQLSDCFGNKVQVLDRGMRIEAVLRKQ